MGAFEFGCSNQNYVKLPECKQVISLDSTLNLSVSSFLKNSRPKIVTLSNMHCFRMIDIPLLRKQIEYLQPIITQYFIGNKSEIWSLSLMVHSKRRRFNAFIDS